MKDFLNFLNGSFKKEIDIYNHEEKELNKYIYYLQYNFKFF